MESRIINALEHCLSDGKKKVHVCAHLVSDAAIENFVAWADKRGFVAVSGMRRTQKHGVRGFWVSRKRAD